MAASGATDCPQYYPASGGEVQVWGEWRVECRGVEQAGEGLTATNLLLTNTHSGDTHSLTHLQAGYNISDFLFSVMSAVLLVAKLRGGGPAGQAAGAVGPAGQSGGRRGGGRDSRHRPLQRRGRQERNLCHGLLSLPLTGQQVRLQKTMD